MHLVVWIREIADTRDLVGEVLDDAGNPRWAEWESRVDPEDLNALEMALKVKDEQPGVRVTAVSVGHPRKLDALRECLYRGVDGAVRLLCADTGSGIVEEARAVAGAVKRLGQVDGIFCGVQINEGEVAHKGALLARLLDWPLVSYTEAIEGLVEGQMRVRRAIEGGVQHVEISLPGVISVGVALLKDDPRSPRSAKAKLKLQHKKTPIPEWGSVELDLSVGMPGSGVRVRGYQRQVQRSYPSRRIDGASEEALVGMLAELRAQGLVR